VFAEDHTKRKSLYLEMAIGETSAPITIIEYASLTCSHCANFHKNVFPKIKKDYIDKGLVKFVHREIYFDGAGVWAALTARCSGNTKKYFGVVKLLYENQQEWSRSNDNDTIIRGLLKISAKAGMDKDKVFSCLENEQKALDLMKEYQSYRIKDNIESTPTFIVNGTKLKSSSYEEMKVIIEEKLGN
jgi:protein-disulfide isomerase